MKKFMLALGILVAVVTGAACQSVSDDRPPLRERLFFGGSLGLQFGTITNIELAPMAGVWVLPRVAVGAGPSYQYYHDPYGGTSIYGGKAMVQFMLVQNLDNIIPLGLGMGIFAQGLYEGLSLERNFFTGIPEDTGRLYSGSFLVGGGISQPTGRRSFMNIALLWSLSDNIYGLYDNPEIRVSFFF